MSSPLIRGFAARIRALKANLDEIYPKTFDDWVQDFELDGNPERELLTWECMALTYRTFAEGRTLSAEEKEEALRVILQSSLGKTEEQMLRGSRNVLHNVEILGLVNCYRAAAEATFAVNQGRESK